MRRLSREQWMAVALALVTIVVTGYYLQTQRDIGDRNQAAKSLNGANRALEHVETEPREYALLALEADLFLATDSSHRYPEFAGHLSNARAAMAALYELELLSRRGAPLLSEAPDVAQAVRSLPQLSSIVAENPNPRLTDVEAVMALLRQAARDELDAAGRVLP